MDGITSFGTWLKQRRRTLGLTQDHLARQVGCATATIRKLEADERRPSVQIAERLAEVLVLPPHDRAAFLQSARAELAADRLPQPAQLPSALPSGTVTFLFTDIAGSTSLWEQYPRAMPAAIARHDTILREAIAACSGFVFKTVGDAVCAVFANPTDALNAALRGQRALHTMAWSVTGLPQGQVLLVRMALHTGVVVVRDGDYMGQPLNRTARLLAAGHGGQALVSRATAELVRDDLLPGTELRDLGEHRLKDLARPEHIFQLTAADLPTDFPPLKTLDARPTNLPAQQATLIGREGEVAAALALLRRGDIRLLTLLGPGGVGKTRLAMQVAADLLEDFQEGAFFVALAPINEPGLVPVAIAQAIGVAEAGAQPLLQRLEAYLKNKRLLLVLDNFEQVLAAASTVAELLIAAPQLCVLVTSRSALRLSGEHEYAVPPLALPEPRQLRQAAAANLDIIRHSPAVRLFIERAQAVKPDLAVTPENAAPIVEICQRLDGLPLAIELAAARCKLLPPKALLERLDSRLALLIGGARDRPARQQTLRDTIAWSYELLSPDEQALFRRLGAFVGGCSLAAAEATWSDGWMTVDELRLCARRFGPTDDLAQTSESADILDVLSALLDQSLLQQDGTETGEARFAMLQTIREYALERLVERGEEDAVRCRQTIFFLRMVEALEPDLYGSTSGPSLARLEREQDNLRATLQWAGAHGVPDLALRMSGALWRFWLVRGQLVEGRRWLEAALARGSAVTAAIRMKALRGVGMIAHTQGDYAQAITSFEEGLALARHLGDQQSSAALLNNLGLAALRLGNYTRAAGLFAESRDLYSALGDTAASVLPLANLGNVESLQGHFEVARGHYEQCLAIARRVGDLRGCANALNALGTMDYREGNYPHARAHYSESLALHRELGDTINVAIILGNLGETAWRQGNYAEARAWYDESLVICQEVGYTSVTIFVLEGCAALAVTQRQPLRAARLWGAAMQLRETSGQPIHPADKPQYDAGVADARAQLDQATFAAAWAAGRALTLEQAIAYALDPHAEIVRALQASSADTV
jgi:predicted ATPase/class 3 adenylate cyclase